MSRDQYFWNFFFTLLFAILLAAALSYFSDRGAVPTAISLFDATLIALATFRLTRLIVYDRIFAFFRDFFLDRVREKQKDGGVTVSYREPTSGVRRTIRDLLACPWCTGAWAALILVFSYYASPYAWFVIFILAIAGLGSLFQVLANLLGWTAEYRKLEAKDKGGIRQ